MHRDEIFNMHPIIVDILLERIQSENRRFEELYSDLDLLEADIAERGYQFHVLEELLSANFAQYRPKLEEFADMPIDATLSLVNKEDDWRAALLKKFTAELPDKLRPIYVQLFEDTHSIQHAAVAEDNPIEFSIAARTLHSDIQFMHEMSGFCFKHGIFIYTSGMRRETLANLARKMNEGETLKTAFKSALKFEAGFAQNLVVHELAHAQVPELYDRDVALKKKILSLELEFYHSLASNESLIGELNGKFAKLHQIEKRLALTIAVPPVNFSKLTYLDLEPTPISAPQFTLPASAEELRSEITALVEERSVLGAIIEGYSSFVSERLLSNNEDYLFFKDERDGNLKRIKGPSAIKREIRGAKYGSELLKRFYERYGKKGLRTILEHPPETYNGDDGISAKCEGLLGLEGCRNHQSGY